MRIAREFLGWDTPCLHSAVRWVEREYAPAGRTWDLQALLIVVPGRRGGRRLLELLAERAHGRAMIPPTIVTLGRLPEHLYHQSDPPVAGPVQALLARVRVVREAADGLLQAIVPDPPDQNDFARWVEIAQDLGDLDEQIGAGAMSLDEAVGRLAESNLCPDMARWEALAELRRRYTSTLGVMGLCDRNAARLAALADRRCGCGRHIVLLATSDVSAIACRMIGQLDTPVTALIHAPESLNAGFDQFGCIVPDRWGSSRIGLDDRQVRFVDRSADQAVEVVASIRQCVTDDDGDAGLRGERVNVDQITVGIGDASEGPMVKRAIEMAGLPARLAQGASVALATPSTLLAVLGRSAAHRRFDDLAALLRHPDIERYLVARYAGDGQGQAERRVREGAAAWLGLLDRYATDHLQGKVSADWLGDDRTRERLKTIYDRVSCLLRYDGETRRPLCDWSRPIADALRDIYDAIGLFANNPYDAVAAAALETIGQALREQAELDPADPATPSVTVGQAVAFTLSRIKDQTIPPEPGAPAIELLGWLELQLDDARATVVCGLAEGVIPASTTSDPFLPDSVRGALGLRANRQQYARDAYLLSAIVASRPKVVLITARRGRDDQPLAPSRLLLACDPPEVAARLQRFYPSESDRPPQGHPVILESGVVNRFSIPHPDAVTGPGAIDRLSVTALGDYLVCPYRFYLKHIARLEAIDDRAVELDSMRFGTLAHEVLRRFGLSGYADRTDASAIQRFLADQLNEVAGERFGPQPPAAVAIQCEQLRVRLGRFAHWQAEQAAEGWRIVAEHIERKFERAVGTEGPPFVLIGRIDRIDHHPQHGYRILDYKTGDTAADPKAMHRKGPANQKQWVSFQLPLYRWLAHDVVGDGPVALGYVRLPKDLGAVGFAEAAWSSADIDDAIAAAHRVVELIRQGRFWPPGPPRAPKFDDGLGAVCMDRFIDRGRVIAQAVGR